MHSLAGTCSTALLRWNRDRESLRARRDRSRSVAAKASRCRRMRQRLRTPSQQAALLNRERGRIATRIGYRSFPWNTHPDDIRLRVPPSGPYSQAWQGVQRRNEISRVGTRRASMYGTFDVNPMQTAREQTPRIGYQNWAAYSFGGGPVIADSMDQATQDYWANQAPQASWLSTFLRRLRGV